MAIYVDDIGTKDDSSSGLGAIAGKPKEGGADQGAPV